MVRLLDWRNHDGLIILLLKIIGDLLSEFQLNVLQSGGRPQAEDMLYYILLL
jgi:hypothetical protein